MNSLSSIELSRENLLHNISVVRNLLGPDKKLIAVVKANAYGHGMREVASVIENHVDYFQVDDFQELVELRKQTQKPILVFGYIGNDEVLASVRDYNATLGIFENDPKRFEQINEVGRLLGKKINVHIEVDALLGRLGVLAKDAKECVEQISRYEYISIEALYGHFSDIEDSHDLGHAHAQCEALRKASEETGIPYYISATSGILADPKNNWGGGMMRLGIGLYGIWPSERMREVGGSNIALKPVLAWKTKIAQIKILPKDYPIGYGRTVITHKETKIAVIPQGYSDGYDRGLSNKGEVLVRGVRCKILGRVAMNMFVVDVSHVPEVAREDEVVIVGVQGNEEISAEELAEKAGTINYEMVARISALLSRNVV